MSSRTGWRKTDGQRLGPFIGALCGPFTPTLHFATRHPRAVVRHTLDRLIQVGAGTRGRGVAQRVLTAGDIPARLYTPDDVKSPSSLLVYFHGGGFVLGSIASHTFVCSFVAQQARCQVLSVDYRLAPEHPFPTPVDDCATAFRWAAAHPEELGIDPTRIAVGGDSAGGNAAIEVCMATRDDTLRPRAAWLLYPVVDADLERWESAKLFARGPLLSVACAHAMIGRYAPGPRTQLDPRISVIDSSSLAALPSTYLATAGMDLLRDQGEAFAGRARAAGVDVELRRFDSLPHAFANLLMFRRARKATEEACAALARMLGS